MKQNGGDDKMNTRSVIIGVALLSVGLVTAGFAGMVGSWVNTELVSMGGFSVTPLSLSGVMVAALGATMLLPGDPLGFGYLPVGGSALMDSEYYY
jgi:uncharacterized membrane protein YeaQ/YmgE (transglycosylase-associated protein family)|tara:strand:- start:211 stop:495 length:285 start_codon:yes stop_codon:yes gene_type:complete